MSYSIVVREYKYTDAPFVNQLVRDVYLSTVTTSWWNLLLKEITFQLIIVTAAVMFIFLGVPLLYCVASAPLVLLGMYVAVYASLLMKAVEVTHGKRALQTWVAEAYEPYFFTKDPRNCSYTIVSERQVAKEGLDFAGYQKKVIGTVSMMNHSQSGNTAWMFRLVVDKRYRKKGVGTYLVRTVQNYCRSEGFYDMQLALSEHQDEARQLFVNLGFQMRLMYHKQLLGSALTLLMCHFECNLKPDL